MNSLTIFHEYFHEFPQIFMHYFMNTAHDIFFKCSSIIHENFINVVYEINVHYTITIGFNFRVWPDPNTRESCES